MTLVVLRSDALKDKVAFVTGGGSGINFGIARNFIELGAKVAICSRNQERLDKAAAELGKGGARVLPVAADVRDPAAIANALERSRSELGPADIVISGAAGNFLCEAEKLSPNGFKTVIDIDLLGSFNLVRMAFDQLKQTRGSIIFISAGLAYLPYEQQVHAGAAKAGIDNMMKNLALEWGKYGIRANSIAPGYIGETEGTSRLAIGPGLDAVIESTPIGRLGSVDDIGQMAAFLCSASASFVTGAVIPVDGGHYLGGSSLLNAAHRRLSEAAARN
jgi:NAD(P)-dependent dehydrogenase (short-subunit alcohol dehydrogenase family)